MAKALLVLEKPGGGTLEYQLGVEMRLGRAHDSTLVINDPDVSRHHALIQEKRGGVFVLVDLGSSNGTFVCRPSGDTAVTLPLTLRNGDVILVGATRLRFVAGAPRSDVGDVLDGSASTQPTRIVGGERNRWGLKRLVASSPSMIEVLDVARKAAESDIPVLIHGETGTGKELVAKLIHESAAINARSRNLVAFSCVALPETLLESELFGHTKGAFTGALKDRAGLFEAADGGTLFLDEIAEMPLVMQGKLLRALEEGEIFRIGESSPRRVHVRIISATNRDLRTECAAGRFRDDLFYRLSALVIHLPPLRERPEDIPLIAEKLLAQSAARHAKALRGFGAEALDALRRYRWPGNVRQLRNEIDRAVALATAGETIAVSHLSDDVVGGLIGSGPESDPPRPHDRPLAMARDGSAGSSDNLRLAQLEAERQHIRRVLDKNDGSIAAAARALGMTRPALSRKLKRLGLRS